MIECPVLSALYKIQSHCNADYVVQVSTLLLLVVLVGLIIFYFTTDSPSFHVLGWVNDRYQTIDIKQYQSNENVAHLKLEFVQMLPIFICLV